MTAKRVSGDSQGSTTTLGDLLYTNPLDRTVLEEDWVRLVASIAAGDHGALRDLFERSHRLVFTLAVRICGDREVAEEVTLDVFHDVWRRSAQYVPEEGTVVGWIMMQARSRAIDRLRFEQRKKRVPTHPTLPEPIEVSGPADAIDARHRRNQLQGALTTLTPDERTAIETAYFSELTYAEAAVHLDQPLGTLKTRIRSGLAKLRKALSSDGDPS